MNNAEFLNSNAANLLPADGEVLYLGKIFDDQQSAFYHEILLNNILWKHDEAMIFGKKIVTKRKVAWYGDTAFHYKYSGITKTALPWTAVLQEIKSHVEKICSEKFNSCLLNLYHDGNEGMAWHSDAEKDLKENGTIASLSFGAARKFSFKHKETGEKIDIGLETGSLLLMKGETQKHWFHRLPPTKKIHEPRINLTFRIIEQ